MRKTLRIISISAGIISAVSTVVLACIYLENIAEQMKKISKRITSK